MILNNTKMNDKLCIKILKELKFDFEREVSDFLLGDYDYYRAKRYLDCINYILDRKFEE